MLEIKVQQPTQWVIHVKELLVHLFFIALNKDIIQIPVLFIVFGEQYQLLQGLQGFW